MSKIQIDPVKRLRNSSLKGDFTFEITSTIARPYSHLSRATSLHDIQTVPAVERTKFYGGIDEDFSAAKDAAHRVVFALREENGTGNSVHGYAMAFVDWNNMVTLHDFAVSRELRGQGWGKKLFGEVVGWAREKSASGIRIETQDNNVGACRFYKAVGARFGGFDEFLYWGTEERGEVALYWYVLFDDQ
ncbi:hypothetical protein QQS21_000752 [Conoideocrella luteorostrata]|uniref:N-acetyltransferase domain-containing protein n=1 Tax=Conoideocrella luteorostrata TaxID=1105319 RepID=A0AAJ0CYC0_9HYPO|nr:hypothetical protein QQS21_000752 [Conoideocrella luteorostrata]